VGRWQQQRVWFVIGRRRFSSIGKNTQLVEISFHQRKEDEFAMELIEFLEKPTARKDKVCYRAKRTSLMWPQHLALLVFLVSAEI